MNNHHQSTISSAAHLREASRQLLLGIARQDCPDPGTGLHPTVNGELLPYHLRQHQQQRLTSEQRLAEDVQALALGIAQRSPGNTVALVSVAQAGVPLGVLLRRSLTGLGQDCSHYVVSRVPGQDFDRQALEAVIGTHGADSIVFVDGWTGSSSIAVELKQHFAGDTRFPQGPRLAVLADLSGEAWMAATSEDWAIPNGLLGLTATELVFGATSQDGTTGLNDALTHSSRSLSEGFSVFIEAIDQLRATLIAQLAALPWLDDEKTPLQHHSRSALDRLMSICQVEDAGRIRAGIAEATRCVIKTCPDQVVVADTTDHDVRVLVHHVRRHGVPVREVGDLIAPYRAAVIASGQM